MAVHDKLKAVRRFLSLSQKEIEEIVDLSQRDISQLENGKKKFIPIEYIQFMNKKGIPLDLLFNDEVNLLDFETRLSEKLLEKKKNAHPDAHLNAHLSTTNTENQADFVQLSPIINRLLTMIDEKDKKTEEKDAVIIAQAKNIGALQKEVEMLQKGFRAKDMDSIASDNVEVAEHANVQQ